MMKKPIVISGFPGIGKSHSALTRDNYRIIDLDSALFKSNESLDFPEAYLDEIESMLMTDHPADFIFVSTHQEVRDGLADRGVPYVLAYPETGLRDAYLALYRDRQSPEAFISHMTEHFDAYQNAVAEDDQAVHHFTLGPSVTLDDALDNIHKIMRGHK